MPLDLEPIHCRIAERRELIRLTLYSLNVISSEYVADTDHLDALVRELEDLRAAARPFAAALPEYDRPTYADAWPLFDAMSDSTGHAEWTIGNLRRLAALLPAKE